MSGTLKAVRNVHKYKDRSGNGVPGTHRERGLLNVGLLVQDTKLIVPVYQLHPGKVSLLHCGFVHRLKTQHLPLKSVDNTVLFFNFDDLLLHHFKIEE